MLRFRDTLSRTQGTLRTRFGDRRWLVRWGLPVLVVTAILAVGLWTYSTVERAAKQALADELVALRDAVAAAVRLWMRQQESFVDLFANQPHLLAAAQKLEALRQSGAGAAALLAAPEQRQLNGWLAPVLAERKYHRFRLMTLDGIVLASNLPDLVGQPAAFTPQAEMNERLRQGQPAVSRPFKDTFVTADPKQGNIRRDEPAMLASAPLRGADGTPFARLTFQMRPEEEFTRILFATRAGKTTEAYAFDAKGVFLTQSRFDEQLRALGLIPPDAASILTLEMRNPGANLVAGERPLTGRFQQPLTRLAQSGIAGGTGVDPEGYLNYCGVPSVGAWTWLPEHGMGLAIEEDADEAYTSLVRLRWVFGVVLALLLLAGVGDIASSFVIAAQQKKLRQAVRESKRLGHYTLEEKLGEGGMGEVYKGSHALLRRQVAIKLLKPELTSEKALARFEREVQLTSRLQHPNTIGVFDYGRTDEGVFYYVMEYLDGVTLEHLVRQAGPLPEARVIHLLEQICGSLEEAHGQGLIHRDIKPANIMACRRHGQFDVVKVLDFGLVKDIGGDGDQGKTLSEGIAGTPLYLAPEAIQDPDHNGPSRDLYALGATAYYLLTGQTVFEGRNLLEICHKHVAEAPTRPSERLGRPLEADLEIIVLKLLAKSPDDRYPSAVAVAEALARCAAARDWTRSAAEAAWKGFVPSETQEINAKPTHRAINPAIAATMDF